MTCWYTAAGICFLTFVELYIANIGDPTEFVSVDFVPGNARCSKNAVFHCTVLAVCDPQVNCA